MTPTDHENYAKELLSSLSDDDPESELATFAPDPNESRNAAKAVRDILRHRLFKSSKRQPVRKNNTTYEWKGGLFNSRNITDRASQWTN